MKGAQGVRACRPIVVHGHRARHSAVSPPEIARTAMLHCRRRKSVRVFFSCESGEAIDFRGGRLLSTCIYGGEARVNRHTHRDAVSVSGIM